MGPIASPAQRRMHLVAVIAAMAVTALIYGLCLPLALMLLFALFSPLAAAAAAR